MQEEKACYERALRNFFKGDKYVELSGIVIEEVDETKAVITAEVKKEHLNANGCVQGGMLYTMADFAFAVLGNYLHPFTVTQCGHINYLRPAFTTKLTAVAKETAKAGHTSLSEVVITGDDGKVCCVCQFNGFVKDTDKEEFTKKYGEEQ